MTDLAGNLRRKWVPQTEYLADLLKTDTNEQAPIIYVRNNVKDIRTEMKNTTKVLNYVCGHN